MRAAGIIFSSLNDSNLSRLTSDRTLAAIPFACRYRLIDFCLSNMVNSNISNICVVANYNYRSLVEHIGSGKDWDLARRENGINMISPFQTMNRFGGNVFSTKLEALKNMKDYINEFREEYVILMDSQNILNIDLKKVIDEHERSGAHITIITKRIQSDFTSKTPRILISSMQGNINDIVIGSSFTPKNTELSLDIFIMKTEYLRRIIEEAHAYSLTSLTNMILTSYKHSKYRTFCFEGYVASVSSFIDYYKCSMELVRSEKARASLLLKSDFPVFTRVHNSAPTVHKVGAKIENSLIADECVIEGTVINSVIFRGVHIGKNSIVRDSVLFHGTFVEDNVNLSYIVTDKNVHVTKSVKLSGNENMPFYVKKGRKV